MIQTVLKTLHGLGMAEPDDNLDQAPRDERKQAPRKFELPPNCVDRTAESSGEVVAVIGAPRQFKSVASKPQPR